MKDLGVATLGDTDFVWEFDGTPDEHEQLLAAIAAAAEDDP